MDQLDAKIVRAIAQVRQSAGKLSKDSFNAHGRYKYVPIDAYYEKIVPLASEAGLVWRCHEVEWEQSTVTVDNKEKFYIRARYAFDLFVEDAAAKDYMTVTVVAPLTGPQTAGQMFSYADKVFMRVAFSVATGESDGDDVAPEDPAPARHPAHDPVTGEIAPVVPVGVPRPGHTKTGDPIVDSRTIDRDKNIESVIAIFRTWMPKITTRPRLHDWYAENLAAIEKVARVDPAAHETIKALFNTRNTELKAMETSKELPR